MKNLGKIIFFVLFLLVNAEAQPVTWMRYYDYNHRADIGYSTQQTFDGGYIITGPSNSGGNHQNILLIKVNYLGVIEWMKLLGDTSLIILEYARKIEQLKDSSYLIVGESNNKMLLLKTDKLGNILWKKDFTVSTGIGRGWSFSLAPEGGIILCGDIFFPSPVAVYPYIVKTDGNGNFEWQKVYSDLLDVTANDIITSENKEYYFCAGEYIRKIDYLGNLIWTTSYKKNYEFVSLRSLAIEVPNVLYAGGNSDSSGKGSMDLIKLDSSGNEYWRKRYLISSLNSTASSICLDNYGNIAMIGNYANGQGDILFELISDSGNLLNYNIISSIGDKEDGAHCIKATNDKGFIIVGSTAFAGSEPYPNVLAIKTDSVGHAPALLNLKDQTIDIESFILFQNYPNPFNSSTILEYELEINSDIKLSIYDITGKQIGILVNSFQNRGHYSITFNSNSIPSGIYFYILEVFEPNTNKIRLKSLQTKKMVILK